MELFVLWLFAQSNAITSLLSTALTFSVMALIGVLICKVVTADDAGCERVSAAITEKRVIQKTLSIVLVIGFLSAIVPDRTGLAIIIGGKIAYDTVQSETGQLIGEVVNLTLREHVDNLKQKAEERAAEVVE